jgi:outer membrane protein TolC
MWFHRSTIGLKAHASDSAFRQLKFAGAASATLLLAGCAVVPDPLDPYTMSTDTGAALAQRIAEQEPITGVVDLAEAMARAIKYNLDHRVEIMQAEVRNRELTLAHYDLLPSVVAGSAYDARNNDNASSSQNIFTGATSLATSTSTERKIKTADIAFSWSILDFGLSYVRARQSADTYLIAEETRRKVAQRIVEDVRTAYWRAVSSDRMVGKLAKLERRVSRALASSREISGAGTTSPIAAVTYERELVEIKQAIQELQNDLSIARSQLAALMNVPPGTPFQLAGADGNSRPVRLDDDVSGLVAVALSRRSELREIWYKQRINQHDLDAALLELLPGFETFVGDNFNSNAFLYNNNWVGWGAKASWNLIRVFQYPAKREVIEANDALLQERALATAMAIATQVHVSRIRYRMNNRELHTAEEYLDVQRRLVGLMRAEAAANKISEQTLIREEMNTLVAEAKRDIAHAEVENAYANVLASVGIDLYDFHVVEDASVHDLAAELRNLRWDASAIEIAAN